MNLKRAIWIGVAMYAASFVVGSIVAMVLGIDLTSSPTIPDSIWQANMVILFVLYTLGGYWYFKGRVPVSGREGANVGLAFVGTGLALELILAVPFILFSGITLNDMLGYYTHPLLYVSMLLIFVAPVIVGHLEEK